MQQCIVIQMGRMFLVETGWFEKSFDHFFQATEATHVISTLICAHQRRPFSMGHPTTPAATVKMRGRIDEDE